MGLVSIVYVSLVVLASAKAEGKGQVSSAGFTVSLGNENACLSEFNAARKAAGLGEFKAPTDAATQKLPSKDYLKTWEPVCDCLLETKKESYEKAPNPFPSGTYAYLILESEKPDCSAAVKRLQDAHKNFSGLPPKKSKEEPLYERYENTSLVALYNPSDNVTADCQVVTCKKTETTATEGENKPDPKAPEGKKAGWALVCLTTPDAFVGEKAPFTEEQWDGISTALKSSALAAVPALSVAFGAGAIGIVALL